MDDKDRKHILNNMNELVRNTKFRELIDGCEKARLISNIMRTRIETLPDADENKKHKELFIKLTKRGPEAYDIITKLLIDLKFPIAANILRVPKVDDSKFISIKERKPNTTGAKEEQSIKDNVNHSLPEGCYPSKDTADTKEILVPFTEEIIPKPFEVKKSKAIRYDRKVPYYRMSSKNRGVFFMVNIIDFPKRDDRKRSGANKDGQDLLHLFRELGFTCFPFNNLTGEKFFEIYKKLLSSDYLKQTESFVMALMSHGEMTDDLHDRVEFCDGSVVKVKDIEDLLSNEVCPSLLNKPKILIFPFCRGQAPDVGVTLVETDSINFEPPCSSNSLPTRSDILVCYASVRGFQALRDPGEGSWYIQTFYKILAEHAHDTHLEDMLKLIGSEVKKFRSTEGYLQTPAYYNHGFNKQLFFNPGVVEE